MNRSYCNDNVDEINKKMFDRNIANGNLETLLDPRSQPTKYVMPFENIYHECRSQTIYYKQTDDFNPGNKLGSSSCFSSNINDESILRNQIYAYQKFPQANYVPNSNSDLYNSSITKSSDNTVESKFPNLFNGNIIPPKNETNLASSNNNPSHLQNLGNNLFNNATRQQLKDS